MAATLSPALRTLIDTRVDSFEKLEIVMALRRAPGVAVTIADLAAATNLDRDEVRRLIRELATAGLVTMTPDSEIRLVATSGNSLDELALIYETDKVALVMAIAESAMVRLRNLAGRALAEAFVIRKKPGGNDG